MTAPVLWTAHDADHVTGGRSTVSWQATGVSIDSRTLEPGDLFVALRGPNFDGHDYVAQALEKGAAAALVERRPADVAEDAPLLMVDDSLGAFWRLGAAARARSRAKFIGVTGSVGKTGTKEAIATCLRGQGKTAASAGNLNNHWGVPLSLSRLPQDLDYAVIELGMNRAGEIRELTRLVCPDVSVITTIAPAHIEFFDSLDGIADAKAEIFETMSPHGAAVLNRDIPQYERLRAHAEAQGLSRIFTFGQHPDATVRLSDYSLHAEVSSVQAMVRDRCIDYSLPLPGLHWVMNSLAVLASVLAVGADVEAAATSLAQLSHSRGRGERRRIQLSGGALEMIDDSYNANPTSVAAAIAVLGQARPDGDGRRIAVLGDMLELGDEADAFHEALAEPLKDADIDLVFICGQHMAALAKVLPAAVLGGHRDNSEQLAPLVAETVAPGDIVMVKGSLGSRMAAVTQALLALDDTAPRAVNGD